jgi:hypothetical protein
MEGRHGVAFSRCPGRVLKAAQDSGSKRPHRGRCNICLTAPHYSTGMTPAPRMNNGDNHASVTYSVDGAVIAGVPGGRTKAQFTVAHGAGGCPRIQFGQPK